MSGPTQPPQQQLALFEFTSEKHADGSFRIVPVRIYDSSSDDVDVSYAAEKLGLPRKMICRLCRTGWLDAWQGPSARGNAKWRIARASVLSYKQRRKAVLRS